MIEFEVMSFSRLCAAAFTFTARVCGVLKSPVKDTVKVADILPVVNPDTCVIAILGIAVTSSKCERLTPLSNSSKSRATLIVALFRLASPSIAGDVETILTLADAVLIRKFSLALSLRARFKSESWATTTIVATVLESGVPQIVSGVVPGQSPLPSSSNIRPEGNPATE